MELTEKMDFTELTEKNGKDGKDGADGRNGQAGSNGLTPEITLSYNNDTGNLECLVEYSNDIDSRLKEW